MDASIDLVSDVEDDELAYSRYLEQAPDADEPQYKKRRNFFFTTPEESINFMSVFKKYDVLYGKKADPSKTVRDHAWMCMSDELGIPVNALKARWRCIKDTHTKVKKKKVGTGWYMMKHLKFLDEEKSEFEMEQDHLEPLSDTFYYVNGTNMNSVTENHATKNKIESPSDDTEDDAHQTVEQSNKNCKPAKIELKNVSTLRHIQPKPVTPKIEYSSSSASTRLPPLRLIKNEDHLQQNLSSANITFCHKPNIKVQLNDPLDIDSNNLDDKIINHTVSLDEEEAAYGYHVGRQLRQFPIYEREILRHKINNLIYQAFMNLKN